MFIFPHLIISLLEVVKEESQRMETAYLIGKKSVDWDQS